ncbi:hypothetical protein EZV62_005045 [Acer yangbiense]|uniref:HORMA domain-containing protein n=1 Tax=Acer yangbiense TaxID=1000413 RepID=A0A5C7ILT1_9ROSI|nr:hypothetical protein EZV62_005045 [Acer yangbiense]
MAMRFGISLSSILILFGAAVQVSIQKKVLQSVSREKRDKEIMREIQAIMRQIASSITYLPCLDDSFPFTWIESDPKLIVNPQMVKLHSFDTKIHKVDSDTLVSYKTNERDE